MFNACDIETSKAHLIIAPVFTNTLMLYDISFLLLKHTEIFS